MATQTFHRIDPTVSGQMPVDDPEAIVAFGKLLTLGAKALTKGAAKTGRKAPASAIRRVAKAKQVTKFNRAVKSTAKQSRGNPNIKVKRAFGVGPARSVTKTLPSGSTVTTSKGGIKKIVDKSGDKKIIDAKSGKIWEKASGDKKYKLIQRVDKKTGKFVNVADGKLAKKPLRAQSTKKFVRRAGIGTGLALGAPFLGQSLAGRESQGAETSEATGGEGGGGAPLEPVAAAPSGYYLYQYGGGVAPSQLTDGSVSAADKQRASEQRLGYLGYGNDAQSIADFQANAGIQVDGVLGEQTAAALRAQQRNNGFNSVSDWQADYESYPAA